jgi:hypothetical protein
VLAGKFNRCASGIFQGVLYEKFQLLFFLQATCEGRNSDIGESGCGHCCYIHVSTTARRVLKLQTAETPFRCWGQLRTYSVKNRGRRPRGGIPAWKFGEELLTLIKDSILWNDSVRPRTNANEFQRPRVGAVSWIHLAQEWWMIYINIYIYFYIHTHTYIHTHIHFSPWQALRNHSEFVRH